MTKEQTRRKVLEEFANKCVRAKEGEYLGIKELQAKLQALDKIDKEAMEVINDKPNKPEKMKEKIEKDILTGEMTDFTSREDICHNKLWEEFNAYHNWRMKQEKELKQP